MRLPPNAVCICTKAMIVGHDLADHRRLPPERMGAHDGQQAIGVGRRADGDELALVGDIERIEAEQLAGGPHVRL